MPAAKRMRYAPSPAYHFLQLDCHDSPSANADILMFAHVRIDVRLRSVVFDCIVMGINARIDVDQ